MDFTFHECRDAIGLCCSCFHFLMLGGLLIIFQDRCYNVFHSRVVYFPWSDGSQFHFNVLVTWNCLMYLHFLLQHCNSFRSTNKFGLHLPLLTDICFGSNTFIDIHISIDVLIVGACIKSHIILIYILKRWLFPSREGVLVFFWFINKSWFYVYFILLLFWLTENLHW